MDLSLKKCLPEDIELLADISKSTFIDSFESQNNPEDFWYYINTAFRPAQLLSELENPEVSFYFVILKGELAGYFKLNEGGAQTELQEEHGLELERIYVHKSLQGRQIGQWMLAQILAIARELNKAYLWLGVWEHNHGAIRFYERKGFTKFGTHPYYIGKDKQTDWLMRFELGNLEPN